MIDVVVPSRVRSPIVLPALITALLVAACATPSADRFNEVRAGMTQDEVRSLLGDPSAKFEVALEGENGPVAAQRWSYGDSLSTLATQSVFRDEPDPRVWTVQFDGDGHVLESIPPQLEHAQRIRRLETAP